MDSQSPIPQSLIIILGAFVSIGAALYLTTGVIPGVATSKDSSRFSYAVDAYTSSQATSAQTAEQTARDSAQKELSDNSMYYLYFNHQSDAADACTVLYPVARTHLLDGGAKEAAALAELVNGPSDEEKQNGFSSFFSLATASVLRSVTMKGGDAYVDFSDIAKNVPATSKNCVRRALQASVEKTLKQFGTVTTIHYEVNGSSKSFDDWVKKGN